MPDTHQAPQPTSHQRRWLSWQHVWQLPAPVALTIVALDQLTKHLVMAWFSQTAEIPVIRGFFYLVHVRNTGAAWGILSGRMFFLAMLSLVVFLLIVALYERFSAPWAERGFAMSLIMGGIVGNLIDRLFYGGVVDFLSFRLGAYQWPAFNVADSAICIGVGIYLVSSFLRPEHAPAAESGAADPPSR